jgi:ParB/RepB/Spo0J family partition protein
MRMKEIVTIDVDKIGPDPKNLRLHFDEEDIRTLADNILEQGQMDPIQVFEREGGRYQIFDGERRWRAFKLAGLNTIAAIVIPEPSQQELVAKRVSRAMQSRSLTPQEEVRALEAALQVLGVRSQQDEWTRTAKKLGVAPQLLRDRMRVARLTESVRQQFEDGNLDLSAAQAVGRLDDPKRQEDVTRFIKENQLHTRFVGTKFIEKLIEYPDKPIIEVYTIALSELRDPDHVPSHRPQKHEIMADRLEYLLADLRRAGTWLEASGREGLVSQLIERNDEMGLRRLGEEVQRLAAMCRAFLKHTAETAGTPATPAMPDLKELPGSDTLPQPA